MKIDDYNSPPNNQTPPANKLDAYLVDAPDSSLTDQEINLIKSKVTELNNVASPLINEMWADYSATQSTPWLAVTDPNIETFKAWILS